MLVGFGPVGQGMQPGTTRSEQPMRRPTLIAAILVGAALLGAADDTVHVGQKPEFKFGKNVDNGYGITSLESFRGKPTLFEFWGTY